MSKALVTPVLAAVAIGAAAIAPALKGAVFPTTPAPSPAASPAPVAAPLSTAMASDADGVRITAEPDRGAVLADGDRRVRVRLTLATDPSEASPTRVPTDLLIVMDRSGSMNGDKMLDAKAAASELVGQLGAQDRFALVSFASDVRTDLPLTGTRTNIDLRTAIEGVSSGGGTAMYAGLDAGLDVFAEPVPGRSRRVVLISDGLPDSQTGLVDLASTAARGESPLTTVGIGMDYDESLMQQLADAGTGNFHWVQRGPQLSAVLGDELDTARETVASGVQVALRSDVGARIVDAAGYPVVDGTLQLGALYSGQERSLWVTLELPPGIDAGELDPGAFALQWSDPAGLVASTEVDLTPVEVTHDQQRFLASVDADGWSDCVVQEDYNELRSTVSAALQRGDADAARSAIDSYKQDVGTMNAAVQSQAVTDNLAEVDQLQQQVEVQASNPRHLRNAWAKGTSNKAYQGRRSGQSKSW